MPVACLLPNELSALVEALKRDSRRERFEAERDPDTRDVHLQNIRMNTRILEAFGLGMHLDAAAPP